MAAWARAVGLSPRTLQRRFENVKGAPTPHEVLLLRLERKAARASGLSADESAERFGYGSGSSFRRALRRGRELRRDGSEDLA